MFFDSIMWIYKKICYSRQGNGWTFLAAVKCATGHVKSPAISKLPYGIRAFYKLATFQATFTLPGQFSICWLFKNRFICVLRCRCGWWLYRLYTYVSTRVPRYFIVSLTWAAERKARIGFLLVRIVSKKTWTHFIKQLCKLLKQISIIVKMTQGMYVQRMWCCWLWFAKLLHQLTVLRVKSVGADCSGDRPGTTGVPRRECGAKNTVLVCGNRHRSVSGNV